MACLRLCDRAAVFGIAIILALQGCAAPGALTEKGTAYRKGNAPASSHSEMHFWRLAELVQSERPAILLQDPTGTHGPFDTDQLRRISTTGERILQAGGDDSRTDLVVLASASINAYAFYEGTQPTIAFTLGMIHLLGTDQDAWAALFGHELAHLRLNHIDGLKSRRERAEVTSSLAGLVLSAIGLPFANVAADAATVLADRAYSRDDEREADRIGLAYVRKAGFSEKGAITLQQRLLSARASVTMPFLNTHPSGEERITALRELMRDAP